MRVLISGGPGAGCTSTAKALGDDLGASAFDSDTYFFKPTDPPYQEQYSIEERRRLLADVFAQTESWILSGSISTWGVELPSIDFGVFMDTSKFERLRRLELRERERFGSRIDVGGDMHTENCHFMEWASAYEERSGVGRNRWMDREFLVRRCDRFIEIGDGYSFDITTEMIRDLLQNQKKAEQGVPAKTDRAGG